MSFCSVVMTLSFDISKSTSLNKEFPLLVPLKYLLIVFSNVLKSGVSGSVFIISHSLKQTFSASIRAFAKSLTNSLLFYFIKLSLKISLILSSLVGIFLPVRLGNSNKILSVLFRTLLASFCSVLNDNCTLITNPSRF